MDTKEIEVLLGLLKRNDISEFELEQEGTKLKLRRGSLVEAGAVRQVVSEMQPVSPVTVPAVAQKPAEDPNLVRVESPIVGTFYRKPTPDSEPFVREGDMVKKGATLCIIEAMKLMNEIDAPIAGRVEKVFLNDGQVAEYGEVLFLINPNV